MRWLISILLLCLCSGCAVLREEPAAPDHPSWSRPDILLTPHIAAMTQPESAFPGLLENIRRFERGERMLGQVDRRQGY